MVIIDTNSDANAPCTVRQTFDISAPAIFSATAITAGNGSCVDASAGRDFTFSVQGGTAPYQYILNGDTTNNGVYLGLNAGTYSVSISDATGCSTTETATIIFEVINNLDLTAGFSINDTEIIDPDLTTGACGAACTVLDPVDATTGLAFIDGNPLPQAPKYIANAALRYGVPVSDDAEVFFSGDVAYRSKVNFFLYESEEFNSDSLTEVGVRAGYATDSYEVAGYVRNLFGAVEAEGAVDFNNFTAFINEPTIWAVEVTKRF